METDDDGYIEGNADFVPVVKKRDIESIPAVDAVERGVYDQVAWERDMAIMQLKDIGKGLGEKMDDIKKVVRCRECRLHGICSTEDVFRFADLSEENRYCGAGKRREDGAHENHT